MKSIWSSVLTWLLVMLLLYACDREQTKSFEEYLGQTVGKSMKEFKTGFEKSQKGEHR